MKNLSFPSHKANYLSNEAAVSIILENCKDHYLLLDTSLRIIYANDSAISESEKRLTTTIRPGLNVLDITDEAKREKLKAVYYEVLQGKTNASIISFINEDGSKVYFENIYKPIKNNSGEVTHIVVTCSDITEKKRAESAIKESEERWRYALEGAKQGVWDWNIKTGEIIYSQSYLKMYGFEQEDINPTLSDWLERVHPEDRNRVKEAMKSHLATKQPEIDLTYRIINKNGDYKWILAKGRLFVNEQEEPIRIVGIHTDLSDSLHLEEELKRTYEEVRIVNERFNIMMKATHDMIWDWDIINNQFYRGEEGLKKVYGVQQNETIQTINQWLERIHPEDFNKVQEVINEVLQATNKDTFDLEYRFLRDDHSYTYVYDRGMIIRNEEGLPIRMIGAAQDISERKKLESDILKNELEHQKFINQATVDSQEQERTEIGKELHDNVNQVLTTTKLYLDLALTSTELKDDLIKKSNENIVSVINEIRQLSRSLMDPSIDDLGLIDSINDLIENINLTQTIQVNLEADASIEAELGKKQKLTAFRIVQESLNNVMRHAEAKNVAIKLFHRPDYALLKVEDDGIGFNPHLVKRGAGLKNIQNRVYLINGTHSITSHPGKGCKLSISFPLNNTQS